MPEVVPGSGFCGFGIDGRPGFAVDVSFLGAAGQPYDEAVTQLESEAASTEGTGLVSVEVGEEAVGRANAGLAEILARVGDEQLLVIANLPPDHPLAAADDELLAATTELANLVA